MSTATVTALSLPTQAEDLSVELTHDAKEWAGFSFRLSYSVAGELASFTALRAATAVPLTPRLFQRIPLGALDRAARRRINEFRLENAQRLYAASAEWLDAVADVKATPDADRQMARLCQRYLELDGEPDWRVTLADEFHYDQSSVQTIVSRARARGFLTQVPRGHYGGLLTPKALRILTLVQPQSAWEQSTGEQRAAALERDRRGQAAAGELLAQLRDGLIDEHVFHVESLALEAELVGWEPREMFPDDPDLAEIEQIAESRKESQS